MPDFRRDFNKAGRTDGGGLHRLAGSYGFTPPMSVAETGGASDGRGFGAAGDTLRMTDVQDLHVQS